MLQATDKDLEFIEEIYKNKNGEYIIDFTNSKSEIFKAASYGQIKHKDILIRSCLATLNFLIYISYTRRKGIDSIFE